MARWPQGSLLCTLGGCRREKQKRRRRRRRRRKKNKKKKKKRKRKRKRKKKKKGRRRQSLKTEAACVASACRRILLTVYQISADPSKVAPGTMYKPPIWQQATAWKGTEGRSGERLPQWRLMRTLRGSRTEKHKIG